MDFGWKRCSIFMKTLRDKKKKSKIRSQKGQVLIEAVLLLTLIVGLWSVFSKVAKQTKWFEKMVNGPWATMSGMIESGVWAQDKKAQAMHPNHFTRVVSLREQSN